MSIDAIVELAARARADELEQQITAGELTLEDALKRLRGDRG